MNITELRNKSQKIAHEARDLLNTIKDDNSNFAEVNEQFARMMVDSDAYAARADGLASIEARDTAMDQIVTQIPDLSGESRSAATGTAVEQREAAFDAYLRGHKTMGELRAMGIGAQDGAITPKTFTDTLITSLVSEGPMLDPSLINMLVTADGNLLGMPTFNDSVRAVIINEHAQIPEGDLSFGSKELGAYKYTSKLVRISNELMQDASIPMSTIVVPALSARIGRGLNEDLTNGTGVNQPEGIATAAQVGVTTALSTGVTDAELIALQHSIDPAYRAKAKWMISDAALLKFRTMKDAQGAFVWAPGLTAGAPARILGSEYVINPHLNGDFSAAKVVALYGDMKAFTVRRVKDIYVKRLDERYADYDQTAFVALARYDSALLDTGAIKALKLKA